MSVYIHLPDTTITAVGTYSLQERYGSYHNVNGEILVENTFERNRYNQALEKAKNEMAKLIARGVQENQGTFESRQLIWLKGQINEMKSEIREYYCKYCGIASLVALMAGSFLAIFLTGLTNGEGHA